MIRRSRVILFGRNGKKKHAPFFRFRRKEKKHARAFLYRIGEQKKTAAKKERDVNGQLDKTNGWFKNILL